MTHRPPASREPLPRRFVVLLVDARGAITPTPGEHASKRDAAKAGAALLRATPGTVRFIVRDAGEARRGLNLGRSP